MSPTNECDLDYPKKQDARQYISPERRNLAAKTNAVLALQKAARRCARELGEEAHQLPALLARELGLPQAESTPHEQLLIRAFRDRYRRTRPRDRQRLPSLRRHGWLAMGVIQDLLQLAENSPEFPAEIDRVLAKYLEQAYPMRQRSAKSGANR